MAYRDGNDNAQILLRTIRLTFTGSGRTRRTEIIYWWFATALISVVLSFAVGTMLPWKGGIIFDGILRALFVVPMFALFVRRLHDQDRSGWWAILLPISIVSALPETIKWISDDPLAIFAYRQSGLHPLDWVSAISSIATLILLFLPGTDGSNRYGNDPRTSGETLPA